MARPTRWPAPVTSASRPASSIIRRPRRARWSRDPRRRRASLDALALKIEPFVRHAHDVQDSRAGHRTVPIGTSARNETEMIRERPEARDVFCGVAGMADLDAIQSESGERLEPRARPRSSGVRQDSDAPGRVDEVDRLRESERVLWHERRLPVSEIAIEGLAGITDPAA